MATDWPIGKKGKGGYKWNGKEWLPPQGHARELRDDERFARFMATYIEAEEEELDYGD